MKQIGKRSDRAKARMTFRRNRRLSHFVHLNPANRIDRIINGGRESGPFESSGLEWGCGRKQLWIRAKHCSKYRDEFPGK